MRNIIKAASILTLAAGICSCSMDLHEPGAIDMENALTSIADADKLRAGSYIDFRSRVGGDWVTNSEVQSDLFQPTIGYGNNWGSFFRWEFTANEGAVSNVWQYDYSAIANLNFFIDRVKAVLDNPTEDFTDTDLASLEQYLGECYFFRAFYHYDLAMRFCVLYDPSTAANEKGIPYVKVYSPTSDRTQYPSRGNLQDTYAEINRDLDLAEQMITTPGTGQSSQYLNADIVDAFRARVYLNMQDYAKVIEYAAPLKSKYALLNNAADFYAMWVNDSGAECLMMLDASRDSNNPATSMDINYMYYISNSATYEPFFLPTQGIVDIFLQYPTDLRTSQFLWLTNVTSSGQSAQAYMFTKFPGNPELFPDGMTSPSSNYLHKNKPFRTAEVYLNLAEAYAMSGNTTEAANVLNELRASRISGYDGTDYAQANVMAQIKNERVRELIGEGFRLYDLKRWGDPVQRAAIQADASALMYEHSSVTATFMPGDTRFIWPIPQAELDANPNMDGEQNPGY